MANPPTPPAFDFAAMTAAYKAQSDQFVADMHAQMQAAMAGAKTCSPGGDAGGLSDWEILAALAANPELRKAVCGLVVAARKKPATPPALG